MTAQEIAARKLSVREAERLVARAATSGAGAKPQRGAKPRDIVRLEERLSDRLTAPVEIRLRQRSGRDSGEIAIRFGSLDELSGLLERLGAGES